MGQRILTGRTLVNEDGTELKHFRAILAGLVSPTFNFLSADWKSEAISQGLLRQATTFMIFPIFAVELLNYNSLKYY